VTTSKGCYVYITLPGQTEHVVAGRFEIEKDVGRFVYARSYKDRADAVEVDPNYLVPVRTERAFEIATHGGIFPPLRDAAPDSWGRAVIDRTVEGQLDEIGYMLNSPDDRAGALGFGNGPQPPAPKRDFNRTIALGDLLNVADAIAKRQKLPDTALVKQVERLHLIGTAMGGARPKAVIEDEEGLWLAKFPRENDGYDIPLVERAMLELAQVCGINVPRSKIAKVGDKRVLFVKRFDREKTEKGYLRHRMIGGLTILRASEKATERDRWSYLLLADELRRLDADHAKSRIELFRRAAFNALISNTDDHPRNHAMINDGSGWRLSPAYDLTPTPMVGMEVRNLAMTVGARGRGATRDNLLSASARFGLDAPAAETVLDGIRDAVSTRWYDICRKTGVTEVDCEQIRSAFVYEGFSRTAEPLKVLDEPSVTGSASSGP
jgi:serine/threonine-protein kinase HipA